MDITLNELYIHNPKLFKTKNLKNFIRHHKIQENDIVKLKGNKIAISRNWVKKNIPSFNLKLQELNDVESINFFEVIPTLEKYNCKSFNPINLNLDSSLVHYFTKDDKRTPYFTRKGLIKILAHFNALPENIFIWIHELLNGHLHTQIDNISNMLEMVNMQHTPILKNINGDMVLSNHIYNINKEDIIVDYKRVGDLKKESDLKKVIEEYKCPVYSQLQSNFQKGLDEAEQNYNNKLKELKQEKVIQHLQSELDKEKSLHHQVLSLTQSFTPAALSYNYIPSGEVKSSQSPHFKSAVVSKLRPSKIQ
jgi:hypothetical protein